MVIQYVSYVYCNSNGHGLANSKINTQIINAPSKELRCIYSSKYGIVMSHVIYMYDCHLLLLKPKTNLTKPRNF